MKKEADGPQALEDLIRNHGIPVTLKNDNSQMQSSKVWTDICRKFCIKQCFTEPHHPHQNQAERYVGEIKRIVTHVLDRSGAPDEFWALCANYVTYVYNRMAHPMLENTTPYEKCHGYTPDISAILHFSFYDPIYFLDSDGSFPATRERSGRFVSFAENVGDALTYRVYDDSTKRVIARSVVRNVEPPNNRLDVSETPEISRRTPILIGHEELFPDKLLVEIDPLAHTGYPQELEDSKPFIEEHLDDENDRGAEVLEATKDDVDDASRWKIKAILEHREVNPRKTEFLVQFNDDEKSWILLSIIIRSEPLLFSDYALTAHGKRANVFRQKRRQFITQLKQMSQPSTKVFKYGVRVPKNVMEANELDRMEGNTL